MNPTPIVTEFEICCPHCARALIQVGSSGCTVVGQQFWLRDGDEIPGIHENLPAEHKQIALSNILSMGQCWSCFNYYYAVECTFMPGVEEEVLIDWMGGFVADQGEPVYLACSAEDGSAPLLLTSTATAAGTVLEHTIGPFKLPRLSDVSGPNGVSACGPKARTEPWTDARDLVLQRFETLQNVNTAALTA